MKRLITILGPTASGKTTLAVELARKLGGEIISADSRQVYRGMDIGTGKDLEEYGEVPFHLIDICNAGEKYNLYRFQEDFRTALADIRSRGAQPILCGGTGLYIESVLKGYRLPSVPQDPKLRASLEGKTLAELTLMLEDLKHRNGTAMHNRTDVDTAQRAIRAIEVEIGIGRMKAGDGDPGGEDSAALNEDGAPPLVFGIAVDRDVRRERITRRLRARLDSGMVDEVRGLLESGVPAEDLIYYGLEYKYVTEYCIGERSYDEMFRDLEIAIHQFAKRQMTWFRGMERRGIRINWIDEKLPLESKITRMMEFL